MNKCISVSLEKVRMLLVCLYHISQLPQGQRCNVTCECSQFLTLYAQRKASPKKKARGSKRSFKIRGIANSCSFTKFFPKMFSGIIVVIKIMTNNNAIKGFNLHMNRGMDNYR